METELKACRDKIKKKNTPKTENLVKCEELRGHLLKHLRCWKWNRKVSNMGTSRVLFLRKTESRSAYAVAEPV